MSLERLTITLHCWPAKPKPRRGPTPPGGATAAPDEALPARRFDLCDVAVEGDDLRDVERFDSIVEDALHAVAARLLAVPAHRLVDLRSLGYATRLEINATAEPGTLELPLPPGLIAACHRLGLSVQVSSDHAVMVDHEHHDFVADD